jgi:CRISPR-associated protein Cas1
MSGWYGLVVWVSFLQEGRPTCQILFMKKLLNTLYVTRPNAYLSLDGETVVVRVEKEDIGRAPLHLLDGIVTFGYPGVSPALLGKCAEDGKIVTFCTPNGKFLSRSVGKTYGNVVLRREQYRIADDSSRSLSIACAMISAKLTNATAVLRRAISDHGERITSHAISDTAFTLRQGAVSAYHANCAETLRGIEGECANRYFAVFDDMILQQKEDFSFHGRNRRPPLDRVNALLSFGYSLMTSLCTSALESAGLDPYVGVFHTERPGRCSLALDLVEEFRAPFVDRFVLTIINKRLLSASDFMVKEDGAVLLKDEGRKIFLSQWQKKKSESVKHPYLGESVEWGMIPYMQAMLLAKYIRGDLNSYPPYLWR